MAEHFFPNGFESWQKTHYEVVEVLTYFRELDEDRQPKKFSEMVNRSGTDKLYKIAIELTDKFEKQHPSGTGEQTLFDAIEEFFLEEKDSF
ncbi:MAG: hypothetical protein ACK5NK_08010 [Niabella sp.]